MKALQTQILVVGGGTGGTAAAIQAARRGVEVILVSDGDWLGGMLTSAGVAAPDGNELWAWQTGLWGQFLRELQTRQPGGLDNAWVSFFTYEPRIGAAIFADWVNALPNLTWIAGQTPQTVLRSGDRILGVQFQDYRIEAQITIDGTELGDLLVLGEIPYRWGWEWRSEFGEPSAPEAPNQTTQRYPVQVPTWVVILQDFGATQQAPPIPAPPNYDPTPFAEAWARYGAEDFLNYGRLPGDRFMINWPIQGNDYGEDIQRLLGSEIDRQAFLQEAYHHSLGFAHFIQSQLGRRYGLAQDAFPNLPRTVAFDESFVQFPTAFAIQPYFRESRRLQGVVTVREQDILPIVGGRVAALPMQVSAEGCAQVDSLCSAIAIGNYANDHHYPSGDIPLKPKSVRWGGRWTGTPFTIPYGAIVPQTIDGFLVCEKNISVTHMANGATRLQPLVLGIGQAAGMAAALCVEHQCQPRELPVRSLQTALLTDPHAPAAVIPLFNLPPDHPDWLQWQTYYLDRPEAYPRTGEVPVASRNVHSPELISYRGIFYVLEGQNYTIELQGTQYQVVTLSAEMDAVLKTYKSGQTIDFWGQLNSAGRWITVGQTIVGKTDPSCVALSTSPKYPS